MEHGLCQAGRLKSTHIDTEAAGASLSHSDSVEMPRRGYRNAQTGMATVLSQVPMTSLDVRLIDKHY
jgi:hypothetical protein